MLSLLSFVPLARASRDNKLSAPGGNVIERTCRAIRRSNRIFRFRSRVELQCVVNGNPPPRVYWFSGTEAENQVGLSRARDYIARALSIITARAPIIPTLGFNPSRLTRDK